MKGYAVKIVSYDKPQKVVLNDKFVEGFLNSFEIRNNGTNALVTVEDSLTLQAGQSLVIQGNENECLAAPLTIAVQNGTRIDCVIIAKYLK